MIRTKQMFRTISPLYMQQNLLFQHSFTHRVMGHHLHAPRMKYSLK